MGSAFCQICGLALNHDGLREDGSIYRGEGPLPCFFPFGPEHAWLKRCVAVPVEDATKKVLFGAVRDGYFLVDGEPKADLFEGLGDVYAGLHEACWELAERPALYTGSVVAKLAATKRWFLLRIQYHNRWFPWDRCKDDPERLADPSRDTSSLRKNLLWALTTLKAGRAIDEEDDDDGDQGKQKTDDDSDKGKQKTDDDSDKGKQKTDDDGDKGKQKTDDDGDKGKQKTDAAAAAAAPPKKGEGKSKSKTPPKKDEDEAKQEQQQPPRTTTERPTPTPSDTRAASAADEVKKQDEEKKEEDEEKKRD